MQPVLTAAGYDKHVLDQIDHVFQALTDGTKGERRVGRYLFVFLPVGSPSRPQPVRTYTFKIYLEAGVGWTGKLIYYQDITDTRENAAALAREISLQLCDWTVAQEGTT
jgi:hypothetical protein